MRNEAPPECDVNVLEKVATPVGITLVGARQAFERWAEGGGGVCIPPVLTNGLACITHSLQVVAREEDV